jgi:hypothetical protein
MLTEPPPSAIGTVRELQWHVLKDGGGKSPGRSRIRQILDAQPIVNQQRFRLATNARSVVDKSSSRLSRRPPLNAHSPTIESTLATLRMTPEFQAAASKAQAKTVAERQAHLDALAKLDSEAAKAWPRSEKRKADSLKNVEDAERALKFSQEKHRQLLGEIMDERFGYERQRNAVTFDKTAITNPSFAQGAPLAASKKSRMQRKPVRFSSLGRCRNEDPIWSWMKDRFSPTRAKWWDAGFRLVRDQRVRSASSRDKLTAVGGAEVPARWARRR